LCKLLTPNSLTSKSGFKCRVHAQLAKERAAEEARREELEALINELHFQEAEDRYLREAEALRQKVRGLKGLGVWILDARKTKILRSLALEY
jgi:hypothetical protein